MTKPTMPLLHWWFGSMQILLGQSDVFWNNGIEIILTSALEKEIPRSSILYKEVMRVKLKKDDIVLS